MKTVIGYPRVGALRESKFASEKYFKKEISADELQAVVRNLRNTHWNTQQNHWIDVIPRNDFSLYDNVLDTGVLLNVQPDCGLKTRRYTETKPSLENMVQAARRLRNETI